MLQRNSQAPVTRICCWHGLCCTLWPSARRHLADVGAPATQGSSLAPWHNHFSGCSLTPAAGDSKERNHEYGLLGACLYMVMRVWKEVICQLDLPWGARHLISPGSAGKYVMTLLLLLATKALLPTRETDSSWDATFLTPLLKCRTERVSIEGPVTSSMQVMPLTVNISWLTSNRWPSCHAKSYHRI